MNSGTQLLWIAAATLWPLLPDSIGQDSGKAEIQIIDDKETGFAATVFRFSSDQNHNFGILDVPRKKAGDTIANHYDPKKHELMINGGYFDHLFAPSVYCKIDNNIVNSELDKKQSGFVAIDTKGSITLLKRGEDFSAFPTVLQSGPYVIDPGGKVGIHSKSGRKARRTLIGTTTENELLILVTEPILLIDLANAVVKALPKIERLLNLDGGPSTALMGHGIKVINPAVVRNYIFRSKAKTN